VIYLQIPNVPGESLQTGYQGQFLARSISWSGSNDYVTNSHNSFATSLSSVSISKLASISSPSLMLRMANTRDLGTVVITVGLLDQNHVIPLQIYSLSDAVLTGYTQSWSGGNLVEDMTIDFLRFTYQQFYLNNDGTRSPGETHYWDVTTNLGG